MSIHKGTTPSISKPASGRPASKLDWNVRPRPAITPRREWLSITSQFPSLWMYEQTAGGFSPAGGEAVIQ
jgi:hypothetical protein